MSMTGPARELSSSTCQRARYSRSPATARSSPSTRTSAASRAVHGHGDHSRHRSAASKSPWKSSSHPSWLRHSACSPSGTRQPKSALGALPVRLVASVALGNTHDHLPNHDFLAIAAGSSASPPACGYTLRVCSTQRDRQTPPRGMHLTPKPARPGQNCSDLALLG